MDVETLAREVDILARVEDVGEAVDAGDEALRP